MKIYEQITPETWCKGNFDNEDGSHCAVGWIIEVYKEKWNDFLLRFRDTLKPTHNSILMWNDAPERTFEEVKAAFEKADL